MKMLLRPAVLLTALFLVTLVAGQASLVTNRQYLDDGKNVGQVLVGPRGKEESGEVCEEGEYLWTNETCLTCLPHNAICEKSRQCCSERDMSCWRYGYNTPRCLCDLDFAWDSKAGECYRVPVPQTLLITAYVALGAAFAVGLCAILVHSCGFCKKKWRRFRGHDDVPERVQLRHGTRQTPRAPRPRRLSLSEQAGPLPTKPPTYEDVYGMPTVSQSFPRAATGSIRSLPPAYDSLSEDPENPPEPEVESPQVVTSQGPESVVVGAEENEQDGAQPCLGVDNPAFSTEHHM